MINLCLLTEPLYSKWFTLYLIQYFPRRTQNVSQCVNLNKVTVFINEHLPFPQYLFFLRSLFKSFYLISSGSPSLIFKLMQPPLSFHIVLFYVLPPSFYCPSVFTSSVSLLYFLPISLWFSFSSSLKPRLMQVIIWFSYFQNEAMPELYEGRK